MAGIKLENISKSYDEKQSFAVKDLNLEIEDKEFIVFVGPSGCGKSTALRMIAGLEEITEGSLYIDGEYMNDRKPKDRNIAMVFQSYALYPHMSVENNIGYGLKIQGMKSANVKEKVLEVAKMLDITQYLDRFPRALSGGQRQRVALGRALVRHPKVFLLDEPLSNLDAKLRSYMRAEITALHKKIGTTFIYVTHDQIEAMTMGTKIVVMRDGFMQQYDTPSNIYNNPVNVFVAGFIGSPQMNFFPVTLTEEGNNYVLNFSNKSKYTFDKTIHKFDESYIGKKVILGVRPEHLDIAKDGIKVDLDLYEDLGAEAFVYAKLDNTNIICKVLPEKLEDVQDSLHLTFRPHKMHLFDSETEQTILKK